VINSSAPTSAEKKDEEKKKDEYDPSAPSDFSADFVPQDRNEELALMKMLGLPGIFDTTKGKRVEGNDWGAVKVKSERVYRQYMNRKGGFNRKLDPDKNVSRDTKKGKKPAGGKPGAPGKPGKGAKPAKPGKGGADKPAKGGGADKPAKGGKR